jgi:hypothetical protein
VAGLSVLSDTLPNQWCGGLHAINQQPKPENLAPTRQAAGILERPWVYNLDGLPVNAVRSSSFWHVSSLSGPLRRAIPLAPSLLPFFTSKMNRSALSLLRQFVSVVRTAEEIPQSEVS